MRVLGADALRGFRSSERVERGFCSICGSALFWKPLATDTIAVAMGAFDAPTRTQLAKHIFVADKGDYYAIADAVPQRP